MVRVRVKANNAYTLEDQANPCYLWSALNAHQATRDFVTHQFSHHPKFYPQLVFFLLENGTPKNELELVQANLRTLASLPADMGKLTCSLYPVESKVDILWKAKSNNGGGGGGRGGGCQPPRDGAIV